MQKLLLSIPKAIEQCQIYLGNNLFNESTFTSYCRQLSKNFAIIADKSVEQIATNLENLLSSQGLHAISIAMPLGEEHKSRASKDNIEDILIKNEMGKDCCLIAVGGGVTTDLVGFIASTYCRGIPYIAIPTTLLGMVDASIGGKNGVNIHSIKNKIGTTYLPKAVFIDIETLDSLPEIELNNGLVECLKHGLIADASYFEFIEENSERLVNRESKHLEKAILGSCEIKKQIVQQDAFDTGMRRILNFGHSVGHAIEACTGYKVAHGQAVGIGIIAESHISMSLGYLPPASFTRIASAVQRLNLDLSKALSLLSAQDIIGAMRTDKKAMGGIPRIVLIKDIGSCLEFNGAYCSTVEATHIAQALEWTKLHLL